MIDEDLDPKAKKKTVKNLDNYSIDELREYVQMLREEALRAEKEIDKKSAHMNAAAQLFKK